MDWSNEKEMDDVTLSEFEQLCDKVFEQKEVVDELKDTLKTENAALTALEENVMAYLEKYGKAKHAGRLGTLSLRVESYPAVPKDPDKRAAFFAYLKKEGVFDGLITVNANTLKAYYKQEREAHEDDPNFAIPGLEPFERKTLTKRRSKK